MPRRRRWSDRRRWLGLLAGIAVLLGIGAALLSWFLRPGAVVVTPNLNSRYSESQPALSGDGRYLAYVAERDGHRTIYFYDLQKRQLQPLPGFTDRDAIAESPSLSWTGRYIAYVGSDRGRPEIQVYDRATQRREVLTQGWRGWVRQPSISPDGRLVAFESSRRGQWDIELFDRGELTELDRPEGSRETSAPIAPSQP